MHDDGRFGARFLWRLHARREEIVNSRAESVSAAHPADAQPAPEAWSAERV